MATATQTKGKAKGATPDAVKAQGAQAQGEKTLETKVKKQALVVIPTLKAGALSKDVGPMVVANLAKAYEDEATALSLQEGVRSKKYDSIAKLTLAIVKAARADKSIDLSVAFATKDDKAKVELLNVQLGLALGLREVVGEGDKQRPVWAASIAPFFPALGEDKDSDMYKRKSTLRSSVVAMLKRCAQSACGIVDKDIEAKMDKSGTLQLTGPAIKAQFGQTSVLLNEKQSVEGAGGKKVELLEKPSFTAIAAKAGESHGATVNRTSNTRGATIKGATTPDAAIISICKSLIAAIEKIEKPTGPMVEAMNSVVSAIEAKLPA